MRLSDLMNSTANLQSPYDYYYRGLQQSNYQDYFKQIQRQRLQNWDYNAPTTVIQDENGQIIGIKRMDKEPNFEEAEKYSKKSSYHESDILKRLRKETRDFIGDRLKFS